MITQTYYICSILIIISSKIGLVHLYSNICKNIFCFFFFEFSIFLDRWNSAISSKRDDLTCQSSYSINSKVSLILLLATASSVFTRSKELMEMVKNTLVEIVVESSERSEINS